MTIFSSTRPFKYNNYSKPSDRDINASVSLYHWVKRHSHSKASSTAAQQHDRRIALPLVAVPRLAPPTRWYPYSIATPRKSHDTQLSASSRRLTVPEGLHLLYFRELTSSRDGRQPRTIRRRATNLHDQRIALPLPPVPSARTLDRRPRPSSRSTTTRPRRPNGYPAVFSPRPPISQPLLPMPLPAPSPTPPVWAFERYLLPP